ncbi:MAG: ABC transporter substrate-binding protein [Candidatus Paceibacterota bacterium]
MNKTLKVVIWVVVIALVIWGIVAISNNNSPEISSDEPIKIGAVLSLTGPAAQDGESIRNGIELAKKDLAKDGIEVEIVYQDDKTEPADTVSAINVISSQNVEAIIGPTWSHLADAGIPVADNLGLVTVMPANTSEYVNAESPYAFFTSLRIDQFVPELTKWLEQSGTQRIAVVRGQDAWYEVVELAVEKAVEAAGVEVVFSEKVPFGVDSATMATVVTKLKATGADLVFAELGDQQAVVNLFRKLQEQDYITDVMSVSTTVGLVISEGNVQIPDGSNVYVLAPKSSEVFADKYQEEYGITPPPYADRSYDSLMLLVKGIIEKGEMSLVDYLREESSYEGFVGKYDFDENGDIAGGEWVIETLK